MLGLVAALVLAHPQGFHKRVTLELYSTSITGLIVMDVDGGERCELLRSGADVNRDGVLDEKETGALKKKLTTMASRALRLWISGYPIAIEVKDTKISLKEDKAVSPTGLSIAVLLEMKHPYAVTPGMSLWFEDTSPDFSPVEAEILQHPAPDAGPVPSAARESSAASRAPEGGVGEPAVKKPMGPGERLTVRLGALASP